MLSKGINQTNQINPYLIRGTDRNVTNRLCVYVLGVYAWLYVRQIYLWSVRQNSLSSLCVCVCVAESNLSICEVLVVHKEDEIFEWRRLQFVERVVCTNEKRPKLIRNFDESAHVIEHATHRRTWSPGIKPTTQQTSANRTIWNFATVPGEPQDVRVDTVNSTAINVQWKPPQEKDRNGIIRGYHIHVQETHDEVSALGSI